MKTYNLELRHAPSKRRINALPGNRLEPLKQRLAGDAVAIDWAGRELADFTRRTRGANYRYVEAALCELLPFTDIQADKDLRRLGRWVSNPAGLVWRDAAPLEGSCRGPERPRE